VRSRLVVFCILFSFIMLFLSFETARKVDAVEPSTTQTPLLKASQPQQIARGGEGAVLENVVDLSKNLRSVQRQRARFSDADLFEINQWRVKNGAREVFTVVSGSISSTKPPTSSYDTYDSKLLLEMAATDPYAVLELGGRYFEGNDLEVAEPWLIKSATQGFGQPMFDLVGLHLQKANSARGRKETEYRLQNHIESLAWMKVVDIVYIVYREKPHPLSDVNKMYRVFEPEEVAAALALAEKRGVEIYNELRLKRQKQGLGDFVSDMPVALQNRWRTARASKGAAKPVNQ
jgi:hypothetical protein